MLTIWLGKIEQSSAESKNLQQNLKNEQQLS